jgi:ribosome-binding factor A
MRRERARPAGQRQRRVGELLRHALAEVLARGEMGEPLLRSIPITVTEVRVSPDLQHASAYVVPLGGTLMAETVAALNRARPFLRARIAPMVEIRRVPDLTFIADETFERAARVGQLLRGAGGGEPDAS